ncbi:MAG: thioredoxin-disulfide reductase [Leptospiraceae bacterium]|nr:thioredoxin-disulfide reductase [Leptospiraceae bacterium]MCB1200007.1 thioredoxin-disulfide reductase [Leptospiraceae bacterium]
MSEVKHYDVIIIGSGPAGYTAAVYAGRANLNTLVLEGIERGGQLMITSDVENFPGFPEGIMGPDMMELFRKQAARFGATLETKLADEVVFDQKPFKVRSSETWYSADAIIIATGASARFLGIPSELAFKGKGVSACATCDGFFFRGKEVAVVGGGDSAMEEANFLTKFATKVTILHRRDEFRASKIMVDRARNNPKIEIKTFTEVDSVYGDEKTGTVAGVKLKDTKTGEISDFPVQGLFIAIGHDPNTKMFEGKLKMDAQKYILTEPGKTKTSLEGVFACGDVQDSYYRQAITAAGSGCMAAIEAERWLEEQHS